MLSRIYSTALGLALSSILITPAFATGAGPYLGFMFGPQQSGAQKNRLLPAFVSGTHQAGEPTVVASLDTKHKYASRFYVGNKFNEYAGMEGGIAYPSAITYATSGGPVGNNGRTCGSASANVYYFDLLGRASIPWNGFELYAKAGGAAAYVSESRDFHVEQINGVDECKRQRSVTFRPTAAVGIAYDLNQNWVTDLSFNHTMVGGIVKNISFAALGISYHLVSQRCGQFLCD